MTGILNKRVNSYAPQAYADMTPREREIARDAFDAGRAYESSLTDADRFREVAALRMQVADGEAVIK